MSLENYFSSLQNGERSPRSRSCASTRRKKNYSSSRTYGGRETSHEQEDRQDLPSRNHSLLDRAEESESGSGQSNTGPVVNERSVQYLESLLSKYSNSALESKRFNNDLDEISDICHTEQATSFDTGVLTVPLSSERLNKKKSIRYQMENNFRTPPEKDLVEKKTIPEKIKLPPKEEQKLAIHRETMEDIIEEGKEQRRSCAAEETRETIYQPKPEEYNTSRRQRSVEQRGN